MIFSNNFDLFWTTILFLYSGKNFFKKRPSLQWKYIFREGTYLWVIGPSRLFLGIGKKPFPTKWHHNLIVRTKAFLWSDHRHLILGGLLKGPASLPCFVFLEHLVAAAKILPGRAASSIHPARLSCWVVCLPALFCAHYKRLFLSKWIFCQLIYLEQSTFLRCLWN